MSIIKNVIASHPFFFGMSREHLNVVAEGAFEATFEAEEILFREGEPANQFYLIQSGHVAVEAHRPTNGTALVQILGPGDVLGWSSLLPPFEWHFQARTLEPTCAIILDGGQLLATAERDRNFGYELLKRLSVVLIQRLQASRRQLLAARLGLNSMNTQRSQTRTTRVCKQAI